MVSAKAACRDITCESIPGSPPPFLFFVEARGEPGNEARGHPLPIKQCRIPSIGAGGGNCPPRELELINSARTDRVLTDGCVTVR